jgi:hypothetical protein
MGQESWYSEDRPRLKLRDQNEESGAAECVAQDTELSWLWWPLGFECVEVVGEVTRSEGADNWTLKRTRLDRVWQCLPVIPALGRLKWEDFEFENSLGY